MNDIGIDNLALDNGVRPGELSEVVTQLAFYVGWPNAIIGIMVAKELFSKRDTSS